MLDSNYPLARQVSLVDSDDYQAWVFNDAHPTQGRRFTNAARLLKQSTKHAGIGLLVIESDFQITKDLLTSAHTTDYINQIVDQGLSSEWVGSRKDLSRLAQFMAGGTLLAVESLLRNHAEIAVHFAGAKHHAMRDRSSGFCVFNDFAIAAIHALKDPRINRIAILDIDAHHGDGTEALLRDNVSVLTFSIHDSSIFPGTGTASDPANFVFNRPLARGSGDEELHQAIQDFISITQEFQPDLLFIAMGADGHKLDPLSTLNYSFEGMEQVIATVRSHFPTTPLLLGGAGGYRPDDITPEAWVRMAMAAAETGKGERDE